MEAFSSSNSRSLRRLLLIAVALAFAAALAWLWASRLSPGANSALGYTTSVPPSSTGVAIVDSEPDETSPVEPSSEEDQDSADTDGAQDIWRRYRLLPNHYVPIEEHIDDVWNRLHDQALGGDADAAYELGVALYRCSRAMRLFADVPREERQEAAIRRFGHFPNGQRGIDDITNCDTDPSRYNSALDWILMAAELGHTRATNYFFFVANNVLEPASVETRDWYFSTAIYLFGKSRDQGSVWAAFRITHLAMMHDPAAAYTNAVVALRMIERGHELGNGRSADVAIRQISGLMVSAQSRITAEERIAAELEATEILERCCH